MPVENVIRSKVIHWDWFKLNRVGIWLLDATKISAKIGAIKNLKAVAVKNETLFKTYLLMAVEEPHKMPAPNARDAAATVPAPVSRFTFKSLKLMRYADTSAKAAQRIKLLDIFSFKIMAAADIAQIG